MANDRKIPKDFKRYFKEIRRLLPRRVRKKLLRDLKREAFAFLEENPDASYESLVDRFGCPKDITDAFLLQESTSFDKVHKWLKITLIVLLILVVIFIFWVHVVIKQNYERVLICEGGDVSDSLTVMSSIQGVKNDRRQQN